MDFLKGRGLLHSCHYLKRCLGLETLELILTISLTDVLVCVDSSTHASALWVLRLGHDLSARPSASLSRLCGFLLVLAASLQIPSKSKMTTKILLLSTSILRRWDVGVAEAEAVAGVRESVLVDTLENVAKALRSSAALR
jgi:hypothetical protein